MNWSTPTVNYRLVNGLTGDPGLLCHFNRTGECLLFDLGSLEQVAPKDLLKVKRILISHTHLDHFFGFDRLLRIHIPHRKPLEFCGPPGLARNVQGKLRGYLWNLIDKDQIKFTIREITVTGDVTSFELSNSDDFALHPASNPLPIADAHVRPLPEKPAAFVTNLDDQSRIEAVCLDHGTPSVGYLCQSNIRFHVKQDELARLNLKPGPWIGQLQTYAAKGHYAAAIAVEGRTWTVGELSAEILTYDAPRPVGYLTDLIFNWENLRRIKLLMQDVEWLVCESNYCEADFAKAFAKKHLTTKQAALIAAYVSADSLQIFHISKLYRDRSQTIVDEAARFFNEFRTASFEAVKEAIAQEIARGTH